MPKKKRVHVASSAPDQRKAHDDEKLTADKLLTMVGLHKSPTELRHEAEQVIVAFRAKLKRSTGMTPAMADYAATDEEIERQYTKGMRQLALRLVGEHSVLATSIRMLNQTKLRLTDQWQSARRAMEKLSHPDDDGLKSAKHVDERIQATLEPIEEYLRLSKQALELLKNAILATATTFDIKSPERFMRFQTHIKELTEIALSQDVAWDYSREVEEIPLINQRLSEIVARLTHLNQKLSSYQQS